MPRAHEVRVTWKEQMTKTFPTEKEALEFAKEKEGAQVEYLGWHSRKDIQRTSGIETK